MVTLRVFHFRHFEAAVASGHFELYNLSRAGFAAHVGVLTAHNLGRAAVGRAPHGFNHKFERFGLGGHAATHFAGCVVHQLGLEQVAAIKQGRNKHGHLYRGYQCIALTDGNVVRFTARPRAAKAAPLPVARGHEARFFVGQVNARRPPESASLGEFLYLVNAHAVAHQIKVYVARVDERVRQIFRAVAAFFPAAEYLIAQFDLTGAENAFARVNPFFKQHGGHYKLPYRAGGIHALNDPVLKRKTAVGSQGVPVALRNASGKQVVVVGGRGHKGPQLAAVWLHNHNAARFAAQSIPRSLLQTLVEGQVYFVAATRFFTQGFAKYAGVGVHFHIVQALAAP